MPSTPKGIAYPNSSDHTRLWEHFQALAESVDNLKLPGERIATATATADSSTYTTTEVQLLTVTAPVVAGRTYRITADAAFFTTVSGDLNGMRIREDSVSGNQLQFRSHVISTTGALGEAARIECEYTAAATENKVFSFTGQRQAGTGSIALEGASNRITYFYVDYIRG